MKFLSFFLGGGQVREEFFLYPSRPGYTDPTDWNSNPDFIHCCEGIKRVGEQFYPTVLPQATFIHHPERMVGGMVAGRAVDPDLLNPDPDPIRIQGFDDQKLKEKNTAGIFLLFLNQKLQFLYVQATGEAFSPQKNIHHFK